MGEDSNPANGIGSSSPHGEDSSYSKLRMKRDMTEPAKQPKFTGKDCTKMKKSEALMAKIWVPVRSISVGTMTTAGVTRVT